MMGERSIPSTSVDSRLELNDLTGKQSELATAIPPNLGMYAEPVLRESEQ